MAHLTNGGAPQDYEEALRVQPSNVLALVRKGEVLHALKKPAVCRRAGYSVTSSVTKSKRGQENIGATLNTCFAGRTRWYNGRRPWERTPLGMTCPCSWKPRPCWLAGKMR